MSQRMLLSLIEIATAGCDVDMLVACGWVYPRAEPRIVFAKRGTV